MQDVYKPCPCGSGKKFKFCCNQLTNDDPTALAKQASVFAVQECSIMAEWSEGGMASILVLREQPNLKFMLGMYIVDYYCLGLKNTFLKVNLIAEKVAELKRQLTYDVVPFDYEDARSLILGGIEYAGKLGFEPQKDWRDTRYIVEADRPYTPKFEFGKDGKPCYINGPYDDVPAIMSKLKGVDLNYLIGQPH